MRRIIFTAQLLLFLGFLACNEKKEEMVSKTVVDEFTSDTIENLSLEAPINEDLIENLSLEEIDELMLRYYSERSARDLSDVPATGKKGTIEDIELLKDYLGKWLNLSYDGILDQSNYSVRDSEYIEIYFSEGICVFKHKYSGPYQIMGYVFITEYGGLCLKGNSIFPYFIVGQPFELDGKPTIFIDCQGPLGFYQLE